MRKLNMALSLIVLSATALAAPLTDTSVNGVYYAGGIAVKGAFLLTPEKYANVGFPANELGAKFTNAEGVSEKINFDKVDSIRIGDIFFVKSPWNNKSIMSMSEEDLPHARMCYQGASVMVFYSYSFDKKEKVYGRNLLVKKSNSKEITNTSSMKFALGFKKQLAKLFEECETVAKKATEKAYGTGDEAVIAASRDYDSSCKQ